MKLKAYVYCVFKFFKLNKEQYKREHIRNNLL